jgi:hypothetical protein
MRMGSVRSVRKGLPLLTLLLALPAFGQTGGIITMPGTTSHAVVTPGYTLNGDGSAYFGNQQQTADIFEGAGYFAPVASDIVSPCVASGSSTTVWVDSGNQPYSTTTLDAAGFWVGATFIIESNNGLSTGGNIGYTGVVTASTAVTSSNGTALTLGSIKNAAGTSVSALSTTCSNNDFMILQQPLVPTAAQPTPAQIANNGFRINSGTTAWSTDVSASSSQPRSLSVANGSISLIADVSFAVAGRNANWINLNGTYTPQGRMKCTGTGTQTVTLTLGRQTTTQYLNQPVTLTCSNTAGAGWVNFSYPFTASENGTEATNNIAWTLSSSGTILYQDLTAPETQPGGNTTTFRNDVLQHIKSYNPGSIRYMGTDTWGCPAIAMMDSIAARPTCSNNTTSNQGVPVVVGLPEAMQLTQAVGTGVIPWVTLATALSPAEWQNIVEYLAGTCGNGNTYTTMRCNQGQTTPWTSVFPSIVLEDGNEVWNGIGGKAMSYGYPPQGYIDVLAADIKAVKLAPDYTSKIQIMASGWGTSGQTTSGGWDDKLLQGVYAINSQYPDSIDAAPYLTGWLTQFNTPLTYSWFDSLIQEATNVDTVSGGYMQAFEPFIHTNYAPVKTAVYEINLGQDGVLTTLTQAQVNQADGSVGAGVALMDHVSQLRTSGQIPGPIEVFTLAGGFNGFDNYCTTTTGGCGASSSLTAPLWSINLTMAAGASETGFVDMDLGEGVAEQIFNAAVKTTLVPATATGIPTANLAASQPNSASGGTMTIAANSAVPLIDFEETTDGAGNYALVVFNKDPLNAYTVAFAGATAPTGTVTRTCFGSCSNALTDNNMALALTATPVVVIPTATTLSSPTSDSIAAGSMVTYNYTVGTPTAATPTFTPAAGAYGPTQSVAIATTTGGATIYYTTNGTTPTTSSTVYSTPVSVTATETLNAIAVESGYTNSAVGTAAFTINGAAATPVFSPAAGTFSSTQSVTLTDGTSGSSIFYCTSSPCTSGGTLYTAALSTSSTTTYYAYATATGYSQSATTAATTYTITGGATGLRVTTGMDVTSGMAAH